jgi:sphingomyelin phosphodiesterase 2
MTSSIKVLTFNTWALWLVSDYRSERVLAITKFLTHCDHDIIGLEEVWCESDANFIKSSLLPTHPYSRYIASGMIGSGMLLLSKFPISGSYFVPFSHSGHVLHFPGEFYVAKGYGYFAIQHPDMGNLHLYLTHMHAVYDLIGDEGMKQYRSSQGWELANAVRQMSTTTKDPIIMMGDFNCDPDGLVHRMTRQVAKVHDAWLANPLTKDLPGYTCDTKDNPFTPIELREHDSHHGKRLDYIFYRNGLKCIHSAVVATHKMSTELPFTLSDHFAVEAVLQKVDDVDCDEFKEDLLNEVLDELTLVTQGHIEYATRMQPLYYLGGLFSLIVGLLMSFYSIGWMGLVGALITTMGIMTVLIGLVHIETEISSSRRVLDDVAAVKTT